MKIILQSQQDYVIRLEKGEELIDSLKKFCQKEKIRAAFFQALGASSQGEIAHYDLTEKKYTKEKFKKPVEILNIVGNIGILNKEITLHAHGLFGDKAMQAFGGHINNLIISATCEIFLTKIKGQIKRRHSKEIGLNLMN